jgi:hypothetical protein
MRSVFSELLGPPGLILLAAFLGGGGAFWAAIKQSELRTKSEGNSATQTRLLQDIAARSGNRKELEELIRTRSRMLISDPHNADDIAEEIIKQLPKRADDLTALEEHKREKAEQLVTEFRLNWEPLIRSTINRFDSLVKRFQEKGVKLESVENNKFLLSVFWGPGDAEIRSVKAPGVGTEYPVRMFYSAVNLNPEQPGSAALRVAVMDSGEMFTLTISLTEAECVRTSPETKETKSQKIPAPKDGNVPKDFGDFVDESLAKVFERMMLLQAVHGGTSEAPDSWRYKRSP